MIGNPGSNYKWYILALVTATSFFLAGMARVAIPVLFPEISAELGLSLLQMGAVWGMEPFAAMLVAPLSGLLIDRFGLRLMLPLICLAIGITGALRGLATGFPSLAAAMFASGIFGAMVPTVGSKAVALWFDRRHLGLANSISIMGVTIGLMAGSAVNATVLSPLLGGWRNVLFVLAAPAALFAVWWYIATRERAGTTVPVNESARVPFREALKRVLRIKQIWLLSLFMFGVYGAYISLVGYLPTYLREIGWAGVQADTALTVFLGSLAGCAPLMALVSDRLGSRKKVIVPAALVAALALALLPWVGTSAVWVLLIVQGVFRSGLIALFVSLVMETEGIGATYVGTAIGVAISIMTLGAAVLPPLGNALADIHLGLPMVFWAAVSVVLMVPLIFVKEAR